MSVRKRNICVNIVVILSVAMVMIMSGCRTHKAVTEVKSKPDAEWQRLQMPVTIRVTEPQEVSIGGTLTMVRDSSIIVSLRFMGMEVGVLAATPDSLTALIKPEKLAVICNISNLIGRDLIPFSALQSLAVGHCPKKNVSLNPEIGAFGYQQYKNEDMLAQMMVMKDGKQPVVVDYNDPTATPFGTMCGNATVTVNQGEKPVVMSLTYNWGKAKWNSEVKSRSIEVPANYRTLKTSNIFKQLLKL